MGVLLGDIAVPMHLSSSAKSRDDGQGVLRPVGECSGIYDKCTCAQHASWWVGQALAEFSTAPELVAGDYLGCVGLSVLTERPYSAPKLAPIETGCCRTLHR